MRKCPTGTGHRVSHLSHPPFFAETQGFQVSHTLSQVGQQKWSSFGEPHFERRDTRDGWDTRDSWGGRDGWDTWDSLGPERC